MNIYQIMFLIMLVLPPIISVILDNVTLNMRNFDYLEWSETIIPIYLVECVITFLWLVYVGLGTL